MIFQKSMDSGTVPSDWKLANITPIFKSDRIISTQIIEHLIKYSIISVRQHGFYPKRNTVTNSIEYLDTLTTALNNNLSVDTIYLDFEKAFDRVPHKRLVKKLESIGICGSKLLWSKSFLSNRKQRLVMGDHVSLWKIIGSGVSQGSVLGPFFIIFINDLPKRFSTPSLTHTDDTKLISINNSLNQSMILQNNLNFIHDWSQIWLLYLNVKKCEVMHYQTNLFFICDYW
jgi:hypothetical protein